MVYYPEQKFDTGYGGGPLMPAANPTGAMTTGYPTPALDPQAAERAKRLLLEQGGAQPAPGAPAPVPAAPNPYAGGEPYTPPSMAAVAPPSDEWTFRGRADASAPGVQYQRGGGLVSGAQSLLRQVTGPGYNYGSVGAPSPNSGNILAGIPSPWTMARGAPPPAGPQNSRNILGALPSPFGRQRQPATSSPFYR